MRAPKLLLVAGVCALPFVLAACGDDNSADEDQITAAITRAATSGDPAACTEDQTQKFTQQTSGDSNSTPQQAIKSCEKDAKNTAADKVEVTDIKVDGNAATATAKATGSIFDGQTLNIALVKEGDQWKLDEFKGFEDFNKDAMINAFKTQLASEPGSTPQAVDCVVKQFQAASDADIEATFTGSDPQAEDKLFAPCGKYFKGG